MDIVLHIGLAKCASSTLQSRVFSELPNYIGTRPDLERNQNFAKQFQQLCPVGGRMNFDLKEAQEWRARVAKHLGGLECHGTCILSSENLSSPNRFHPRPLVAALERFRDEIWTDGAVKVVLVIRNQIDRMGSLYAQFSHARSGAGQSDFRKFVVDCIEGKFQSTLHYSGWASDLLNVLGRENVCILPLEEMDRLDFWEALRDFCDFSGYTARDLHKMGARKRNTRSSHADKWDVRPLEVSRKARAQANFILNKVGLKRGAMFREQVIYPPIWFALCSIEAIRHLPYRNHRDQHIIVDDEIRQLLVDHCRDDNRRLEALLNRDLESLGYPV